MEGALSAGAYVNTTKNFVTSFWRAAHKCHDMLAGLVVVSAAALLVVGAFSACARQRER